MKLKFWKMHGLGNDYIVVDNRDGKIKDTEASGLAKRLCERRFSVGADGLLLLCDSARADVRMRIFNSDGSEAEMCGNGIRCLARYCYENNIVKKSELRIETLAGVRTTWLCVEGERVERVRVNMERPIFERSHIPMLGRGTCINENIKINKKVLKVTCLSIGNPHCVTFVSNLSGFPVQKIGPKIEAHSLFPKRTNVEFVQVLNRHELRVRVWERGCGETLACGTGACASVVAATLLQKVDDKCTVHLLGGDLEVQYSEDIFMTGPVEKTFEGETVLEETT